MAKSIKFSDDTYLDISGITRNKILLNKQIPFYSQGMIEREQAVVFDNGSGKGIINIKEQDGTYINVHFHKDGTIKIYFGGTLVRTI